MGKQLIDNIFVIASMKLSVALFAAAAAWDQPAWKDVQAALNDEGGRADFDWGHPIDDSSKKWYHCPTINETAIVNLDSIKCKKSTCALKCLPGFLPLGHRRAKCKYSKTLGTYRWKKEIGTCRGCDVTEPQADSADVTTTCVVNSKTNRRVCSFVCPEGFVIEHPSRPFKGRGTRLNCKCPRKDPDRACSWYKKRPTSELATLTSPVLMLLWWNKLIFASCVSAELIHEKLSKITSALFIVL